MKLFGKRCLFQQQKGHCTYSKRLIDLLNEFDGLILDGSGVINVGNDPIDGIKELFLAAKTKCKPIVVLSNAASFPNSRNLKKYQQWGLPLTKFQLISSRDVISEHFKKMLSPKSTNNRPPKVGFLGTFVKPLSIDGSLLYGQDHDFWDRADVFVFLGALEWKESDQMALEKAMIERPRPIHVANPDVAAPQPEGKILGRTWLLDIQSDPKLSRERILGNIFWYGKPHKQAFSFALSKIEALAGKSIRPGNICMVGDTLHTDILGGMAGASRLLYFEILAYFEMWMFMSSLRNVIFGQIGLLTICKISWGCYGTEVYNTRHGMHGVYRCLRYGT